MSQNEKLEEVQRERDHHFLRDFRVKKKVIVATKFAVNVQKHICQHASMAKQMQSVLGSGVLNFTKGKMKLSASSTRTTHHIRGKRKIFQINNIVVNF